MIDPRYFTRFELPTEGMASFTVLIRSEEDPERESRKERQARGAGHAAGVEELRRIVRSRTPAQWADAIVAHLGDGVPRTFNRIALELTGKTADMLFTAAPHQGLAAALLDGRLACTAKAPIFFVATGKRPKDTRSHVSTAHETDQKTA